MKDFSWGIFLVLAAGAVVVALDVPIGPLLLLGAVVALLIAYRYPYFTFNLALALSFFLGFTISIPTGSLTVGERAFGGAIDIGVGEAMILVLLVAWALKIILLWLKRHDRNWRPTFPLLGSYLALVAAHLASAFSVYRPDPVLVAKFAMRPVLFCYLAFVALPVNMIRSRRRLLSVLGIVSGVGTFAALNGLVSLFFVGPSSQFIRRAHPLPLFGIPALGDNHNLLAELLVVSSLITFACMLLVKRNRARRLLGASAILQIFVGLLTFSRTGWIVFALEALVLGAIAYRDTVKRHARFVALGALVLLPFVAIMLQLGLSTVAQSSNSTRLTLLEIAADVFSGSPIVGGGAGTFVERVGSARVFTLEYGAPLDSHGVIQKLAAETGMLGLAAFAFVLFVFFRMVRRSLGRISGTPARVVLLLATSAGAAVVYQLFNTNYWTGKMWLPFGLTLAAISVLSREPSGEYDT